MEKPEILYKKNYDNIKRICYVYSKYYHLDYEDLLSLANESFMISYKKYTYNKVPFKNYMLFNLMNRIKNYKRKENWIKNKENFIIFNPFFIENYEKSEINIEKNTKKMMNDIISLLTLPNFKQILQPFLKSKMNMSRIPEYAIKNYLLFHKKYRLFQITEAFQEIKLILREDLI